MSVRGLALAARSTQPCRHELGLRRGRCRWRSAQHFFPQRCPVGRPRVERGAATRFVTASRRRRRRAAMWNGPAGRRRSSTTPRRGSELWTRVPLADHEVIAQLTQLAAAERRTSRRRCRTCFSSRARCSPGSRCCSPISPTAQRRLIEERDEASALALFPPRSSCSATAAATSSRGTCRDHVAAATGQRTPGRRRGRRLLILRAAGSPTKTRRRRAGRTTPARRRRSPGRRRRTAARFAALLGLSAPASSANTGRRRRARLARRLGPAGRLRGRLRDHENCPVPTVLPTPRRHADAAASAVRQRPQRLPDEGRDRRRWLGGAQGFTVTWAGALLVEQEGTYEFWAGAPTPGDDQPDCEAAEHRRWRVDAQPRPAQLGDPEPPLARRGGAPVIGRCRCGAAPTSSPSNSSSPARSSPVDEQVRPQHTGFQVKYAGPTAAASASQIPHRQLFAIQKDAPLGDRHRRTSARRGGVSGDALYRARCATSAAPTSAPSRRCCLRTGSRCRRNASRTDTSELGYMLGRRREFAGAAYYRCGGGFTPHAADFDFNFLPLARRLPSAGRPTARQPVAAAHPGDVRLVGADVRLHRRPRGRPPALRPPPVASVRRRRRKTQPADPGHAAAPHRRGRPRLAARLRYFQGQQVPVYAVTSADLEDERWTRPRLACRPLAARAAMLLCRQGHRRGAARPVGVRRSERGAVPARPKPATPTSRRSSATAAWRTASRAATRISSASMTGCASAGATRWWPTCATRTAWRCPGRRASSPPSRAISATSCCSTSRPGSASGPAASRRRSPPSRPSSAARRLGLEPGWAVTARLRAAVGPRVRHASTSGRRASAGSSTRRTGSSGTSWRRRAASRRSASSSDRLRDAQLTVAAPGGARMVARPAAAPARRPPSCCRPRGLGAAAAARAARGADLLGTPERDARPSWLALLPVRGSERQQATRRPSLRAAGAAAARRRNCRTGWRRRSGSAPGSGASPRPASPPAANAFAPHRAHGARGLRDLLRGVRLRASAVTRRVLLLAGRRRGTTSRR